MPLGIVRAILDVEGDGKVVEYVLSSGLVVVAAVEKEGLLVREMEVVFDLVVELDLEPLLALLLLREGRRVRLRPAVSVRVAGLLSGLLLAALQLLLLARLCRAARRCRRERSREACADPVLPHPRLLVRVLAEERLHMVDVLDLGPHEVDALHLVLVVLNPPVAILEEGTHHDGVVADPDVVPVEREAVPFSRGSASRL